ncbi:hypothetical protein DMB42_37650 [Nonomuraea sp. WAC 01424]|uniref:hypothetical protein n=1 Tax=Nonomuraea sp. WAC 01424 TaxID=2203200 RepID=UPI000F7A7829|nr:hypothetical protein [Nonomuraea sp. WAC 01424]RSN01894.1 hypothetical protein DMB42_37650 [Nonomuraea sp. WAC 01424]
MTEPSGGSSTKPRRPVAVPIVGLVALTAVGITALLGGLNEGDDKGPDALGAGATLDQGRYSTRFVESRVKVDKAKTPYDEDKRFVELVFEVTNKGDETSSVGLPPDPAKPDKAWLGMFFANSLVSISPKFPKESGPFVYALNKGDETRQLHPGVTSQVLVRYRLGATERPPDKITLDVATFEYAPGFEDQRLRWQMVSKEEGDKFVPEIKARVTLPVKAGEGA